MTTSDAPPVGDGSHASGVIIRVAVADDLPCVRNGFISLFQRQDDMVLVGAVENAPRLLEVAERERPDVVLTDLRMPGDVPATIRALRRLPTAPSVIVFSAYDDDAPLHACIDAGAAAYVLKVWSPREVLGAVRDHARWRGALVQAGAWPARIV